MFDCAKDILDFHNVEVSLPQSERTAMKKRRNANRSRIRDGLKDQNKPSPIGFGSQGSYAMKTMIQESGNDYDIDDGLYFKTEILVGPNGGEMSPLQVRQMVRDAVDDGSFKTPPETLKNCVRVHYQGGFHVDIPSYREVRTTTTGGEEKIHYELASSSWKQSDPLAVTEWFDKENQNQSPDGNNGRQLRRMVRLLKKFARSRASWKGRIATGFMITKLVTERYRKDADREDVALRNTMIAIRDRLKTSLEIQHPVLTEEYLTKGPDDARAKFFLDKLEYAVDKLEVLDQGACTEEDALGAWDEVFNTDFFSKRASAKKAEKAGGGAVAAGILIRKNGDQEPRETEKDGGGRYG